MNRTQLQRLLKRIPRATLKAHGYHAHMATRPKGEPRHHWARTWAAKHGFLIVGADETPSASRKMAQMPRLAKRPTRLDVNANAFLLSYEWRQLRMRVLTKRGTRCECCGASPKDGVTVINVDHIKPRRLFPELALDESNLQVLCGPCNHGKGNWDQTDWRDLTTVTALVQVHTPRLVKRPVIHDEMTDEQACRIWEGTVRDGIIRQH